MREQLNPQRDDNAGCPQCRQPGRAVSAMTIEAMLIAEAKARLSQTNGFHFCATPECDVVYFRSASGEVVLRRDVRVPIFQKSQDPNRLVCYCFGFTEAMAVEEIRATGRCTIPQRITAEIKAGNCACEIRNPQGSCCLGNVQAAVKRAMTSAAAP
jgi:hypothetical protein